MAGRKVFHTEHKIPEVARLERLRKKRGESMRQFANSLGVSWRVYQSFAQGIRRPRPVIMRVAELLERYEATPPKKRP